MLQAQYIAHITVAGERWDLLAWTYYGDATLYSPIIMANPIIPIEPAFEAGLSIASRNICETLSQRFCHAFG